MVIKAKSIRNLSRHFAPVPKGAAVIVGIPLSRVSGATLKKIGFPAKAVLNSAVLPASNFGPISAFNANGKEIIHHDKPLETVTRSVYATWNDWHGRSHSGYQMRSFRRRPRTFIKPPSIELRLVATVEGEPLIICEPITYDAANENLILHRVNLFLEIFGECEVFTDNLERIIQAPVQRLNWRLLPPGKRPFAQLKKEVEEIVRTAREEDQPLILKRLETINGHGPEFVAIGEAGFLGYLIFGFPKKALFLSESMFIGNATYVFGENWQHLSQLTKAEILDHNLARERIIHRDGWHRDIHRLLA